MTDILLLIINSRSLVSKVYFWFAFFISLQISSQERNIIIYKEVILDGKPAKLNVETGEIILVNKQEPKAKMDTVGLSVDYRSDSIPILHRVKKGETLLDISKHYGIPLNVLKERNNLETTLVNQGQVLQINDLDFSANMKPNDSIVSNLEPKPVPEVHVVKKDETLYSISKRYGLTVDALKKFNGLSSNLIRVGQDLQLTPNQSYSDTEPVDFLVVKKGDTLYSLAKRFNTSVEDLKQLNGLNSNTIIIGQKLRVK